MQIENDFSKGSITKNIMSLAFPMILAQLVNVLYSIVDRIYIARMPGDSFLALTGIGICLPIISMVMAFANLFGVGGAPLCSIERGRQNIDEAEKIMGNAFIMLIGSGFILTILGLLIKKPVLYLFGASEMTYPYANQYITIYLLGNIFVMISLGMNPFINAQGFGRIGMITVILGALANIILDPIFIFKLKMGVRGAAIATFISQALSACWVLRFLTGEKAILKLRKETFQLQLRRVKRIIALGTSGFVMSFTNSIVQVVSNTTLQLYGGDMYIGIMTVINSVREFISMPVSGLTNGAQPVIAYNYGARKFDRVKRSIIFTAIASISYNTIAWSLIQLFPEFFIRIFNKDLAIIETGIPMMRIYYAFFFLMALQFTGQTTFIALGKAKHAVFFSTFRKVILVTPLVILLPRLFGLGSSGVFWAEAISQFVGASACFITMLFTVRKEINKEQQLNFF